MDAVWLEVIKRAKGVRLSISTRAADEFLLLLCALPFLVIDHMLQMSDVVTRSDASEYGGGVCSASMLTEKGLLRLARLGLLMDDNSRNALVLLRHKALVHAWYNAM